MKKRIFLSIMALFLIGKVNAQQCMTVDVPNQSTNKEMEGMQETSCLLASSFVPNANTPIITFRINFHFFKPTTGSGPFDNVQLTDVQTVINDLNTRNANLQPPTMPVSPAAQPIQDTRIKYALTNIYFHTDDRAFGDGLDFGLTPLHDEYGINTETEVNVFFIDYNLSFDKWGEGNTNLVRMDYSCFNTTTCNPAQLLFHELGHAVADLDHTFNATQNGAGFQLGDVFYDNNSAIGWNDCTPGVLSNNVMSYNKCQNYLSPSQIAAFHEKVFKSGGSKAYTTNSTLYYPLSPIIIDNNTIWEDYKFVNSDVIIKSGKSLTIKCLALFPDNASIIVERGGKLIIDGGQVNKAAFENWEGIQVWGDRTKVQNNNNQGYVVLQNNAIVAGAVCGITLSKNGEGWNYNGGVIQAENSTFLNNIKHVEFMSYHSPTGPDINKSYLNNCTLKINSYGIVHALDGDYVGNFLTLWDVREVKIQGCVFDFEGGINVLELKKGAGIYSEDAGYFLTYSGTPNNLIRNSFKGFTNAIIAKTMVNSTNKIIRITASDFESNIHSITGNTGFSTISNNSFKNPRASNIQDTWAIYLDGAKGFNISSNSFNETDKLHYGIIVKNSGSYGGIISKNTFGKNAYAIQTEQKNNYLQIKCNDFVFNKNAITVNPQSGQGGLANQGMGCGVQDVRPNNKFVLNNKSIINYLTSDWEYYAWNNSGYTYPTSNVSFTPNNCSGEDEDPNDKCILNTNCKQPPCIEDMEMNLPNGNMTERFNRISEIIRFHSENNDDAKIIKLLEKENNSEARRILIPNHIERKEFVKAQAELTKLDNANFEDVEFKKYYEVVLNVKQSGRRLNQLTASEIQMVESVSLNESFTKTEAEALLEHNGKEAHAKVPEKETISTFKIANNNSSTGISTNNGSGTFNVKPNPFTDKLKIEVKEFTGAFIVTLYNVLGEEIIVKEGRDSEITIETSQLPKGTYTAVVRSTIGEIIAKGVVISDN